MDFSDFSTLSLLEMEKKDPSPQKQQLQQHELEDTDGWKTIHVFRGKRKELQELRRQERGKLPQDESQWVGQVEQDRIISSLYHGKKTNGFFLDLAANAAVYLSNTYALERKLNWTGVCVEANPEYWENLARMRSCHVVAAVAGSRRMDPVQFELKSELGGIVGYDNQDKTRNDTKEVYYTVPLVEILDKFHAPNRIDYFSLDVEGAELFIMKEFPFDRYLFQVLTVERPNPELVRILRSKGYRFLKRLSGFGELLFAHESVLPELDVKSIGINKEWSLVDKDNTETKWQNMNEG